MKRKLLRQTFSGFLAGTLAVSMFWGGTIPAAASDTLPYLGESARGQNQPYGHGYRAEDFLDWSPETDPYAEYMRAFIPLQDRNAAFAATQANPGLSSETQWFTLAGDYGNAFFDSYSYTNEFSQYLFNFWQLTDYYGSWHGLPTEEVPYEMYVDERGVSDAWKNRTFEFGLVNMPNAGYTNAAHKNGVLSIGCIFLPRTGLKHTVLLTQDEDGNFPYADKLIEMCEYYGFDGWFINQEEGIPTSDIEPYKLFMKQMRDAGIYIQWYDSVVDPSGGVRYQNEFNSSNSPFVVEDGTRYSDSIFLNYWWNNGKLSASAEHAKNLGVDPLEVVFAGIEAGGDRWNQGYDLRNNLGEDGQPMNSIASLGSEFVHDGLDEDFDNGANDNVAMRREKDEFQWMTFERERRWWSGPYQDPSKASSTADRSTYPQNTDVAVGTRESQNFDGVAAYITERSVINGDTFVTNFNTGHGLEYRVEGQASGSQEWSNIIIQDILPTWQWWVDSPEGSQPVKVDFDYGTKYKRNYDNGKTDVLGREGSFDFDLVGAYNGGSSLVLYGPVGGENFVHLYKTDLAVKEASKMDVTFKKSSDDAVALKLGVIFQDAPETVVKLDIAGSAEAGSEWKTSSVDLSDYQGKKIAAFGLVVDGTAEDYQANIGQMKYTSGDAMTPAKPSGFTIDKAYDTGEMTVSWDMASYDEVKEYHIYAQKAGKEIFLGGTYDEVFYIKNVNEAIAEAEAAYVDSVTVVPGTAEAEAGSTVSFSAEVEGYTESEGQVRLVLKAVSADGTESEGAVAEHNYADAVKNVQVTAEDGSLVVTWEGGEADVVVTKEYSTDTRSWTASGTNGCTVTVPTGAEADFARYTMAITKKGGDTTTFDSRMDDSYCRPYTGKVNASNKRLEVPLSKDWHKMVYTTVVEGVESEEKTVTRYKDNMPTVGNIDSVKVKLIDYRGNESEVVEVPGAISISVSAEENSVAAGGTVQFTATVRNFKDTDEVTWRISGDHSAKTTIDENGLLTVDESESASRITVEAVSVENPSASGSANVSVTPAYMISPNSGSVYKGEQTQFVVQYKGEDLPVADYNWSVESAYPDWYPMAEGTQIDENGVLTVDAGETAYSLIVKATSKEDKAVVYSTGSLSPRGALAISTDGYGEIEHGKTRQYTVTYKGEDAEASLVNWTVEGNTDSKTTISEAGLLTVGEDETATRLTVKATLKTNDKVTASDTAQVVAALTISPESGNVYKGGTTQFTVMYKGTEPQPATDYIWSVEAYRSNWDEMAEGTSIDENGLLTVDINETAALVVSAVSKENEDIELSSGRLTIAAALEISAAVSEIQAGDTLQLTVNYKGEAANASLIDWKVEGNTDPNTGISADGLLTVGEDEAATNLNVTAALKDNSAVTASMAITVKASLKGCVSINAGVLGVSGHQGGNEAAESALDGNDATKWCEDKVESGWLAIDLGDTYDIDRWVVKNCGINNEPAEWNTAEFALEVLKEGATEENLADKAFLENAENWTEVKKIVNTEMESVVDDSLDDAVTGRYFRLRIDKPYTSCPYPAIRIHEFQLFGTKAESTSAQISETGSTPEPGEESHVTPVPGTESGASQDTGTESEAGQNSETNGTEPDVEAEKESGNAGEASETGSGTDIIQLSEVKEASAIQEVIWSVEGNQDENTTITQDGLLTIGENEAPGTLVVRAVSKVNPDVSGTAEVTVTKPDQSPSPEPEESTKPSESPKPEESTKPSESPKPEESTKPSESPKPEESTKPEESQKPEEPTQSPLPSDEPGKPEDGTWVTEPDGNQYWYEDGVKQGTEGRGKEIYDPSSDAWYWLDAVDGGKKAVNKDVYMESLAGIWAGNADGSGKWVRYDADGRMVKGWDSTEAGTYYFDPVYGTMAKGYVMIEGELYFFDNITGIGTGQPCGWQNVYGWVVMEDGSRYWYEDGVKQGIEGRGKEIYDPVSDAWYWLDAADGGKKAVNKDVYMESAAGAWAENPDGTGKWVRYDANGHMVKGWNTTEDGTWYFDPIYGTMAKGTVIIDGSEYRFDVVTGVQIGKRSSRPETGRRN